jgi:hypothetical protein
MLQVREVEDFSFVFNTDNNKLGLSISEYGRFASKSKSNISERCSKNEYIDKIYSVNLKGNTYKIIPAAICLQWLVLDKPEKINLFTDEIYKSTKLKLDFPDFKNINIKTYKSKNYEDKGLIYLFESNLGVLKLGFTKNVNQRLKGLQRWDGELSVIDVVKGTIRKEKNIHKILHATGDYYGEEWYPISRKEEILQVLNFNA